MGAGDLPGHLPHLAAAGLRRSAHVRQAAPHQGAGRSDEGGDTQAADGRMGGSHRRRRAGPGGHHCHDECRHSCARRLFNAGAPVLTVQSILGHKFVDTTLGYARLYDGTVTADYYRAMAEIESRLDGESAPAPPDSGQLLALVDSLQAGTLNDVQRETVQALRTG
ncbi:MAG: hypothetical protein EHM56_08925, partial [Chloroflexi bacterium]